MGVALNQCLLYVTAETWVRPGFLASLGGQETDPDWTQRPSACSSPSVASAPTPRPLHPTTCSGSFAFVCDYG